MSLIGTISVPMAEIARPASDDPAAVLLTSGSTGEAKAVVLSHANLLAFCAGANGLNGLDRASTSLN